MLQFGLETMKLTSKKLDKNEIDQLVQRKVQWILTHSRPQKIILFGSAATYEMTDSSDIDLIVIYQSGDDLKEIEKTLFKNRLKDDWPHDLFLYTPESFEKSKSKGGGICWLSEKEGRILFERRLCEPS